jgi:tripartite-type tricarboxylate transporter receptor subunit TctC
VGLGALPLGVRAQAWPARPVSLIVPFAPGGASDIVARILAQKLSVGLGQNVVVENRGGAGGIIATEMVARAAADGHVILWGHTGTLAVSPFLHPRLGYDPMRDFAFVALVARVPMVLLVNPGLGVRTLAEFIAKAKSAPGAIDYGSAGPGSNTHIGMVAFMEAAGITMTHVPYRGSGPVMTDLMAGVIPVTMTGTPAALPLIRNNQAIALGVTASERLALLPDVPTMHEQGLAGFDALQSHGVVAPRNVPPEVVAKLNAEINAALRAPDVAERLAAEGARPDPRSPEEWRVLIAAEQERWGGLVRRAGLKPE